MTKQATLFEDSMAATLTGPEMRDLGMDRVKAAADPFEVAKIEEVIRTFARLGRPFTAWTVRLAVGHIERPNLMGALFHAAAQAGEIERIGSKTSEADSRRSGVISVWRGTKDYAKDNFAKEKEEMARDKETLAIERMLKIITEFPDQATRYRVIDYVAKRSLEGVRVADPAKAPETEQAKG